MSCECVDVCCIVSSDRFAAFYCSDGTARGGEKLGDDGVEYLREEGKLQFKHGETSKSIKFYCAKNLKVLRK